MSGTRGRCRWSAATTDQRAGLFQFCGTHRYWTHQPWTAQARPGCHGNGGNNTPKKARVNQVLGFRGIERVQLAEALAGDIVLINGVEELCIGATLADIDQPEALPMPAVDEPTLTMNFQVNTSPFAGKEGKFVTSRQLRERLEKELLTNVAMKLGGNRGYRFIPGFRARVNCISPFCWRICGAKATNLRCRGRMS